MSHEIVNSALFLFRLGVAAGCAACYWAHGKKGEKVLMTFDVQFYLLNANFELIWSAKIWGNAEGGEEREYDYHE